MVDTDLDPKCSGCGYPLHLGEHADNCPNKQRREDIPANESSDERDPEEKTRRQISSYVQEWVKLGIPERYQHRLESQPVVHASDINWGGNDEEKAIADKSRDVLTLVESGQPLERIVQALNELISLIEKKRGPIMNDNIRVEIHTITSDGNLTTYKIGR